MAHIAIDARKYFDFGIGTYIQNIARCLAALESQHRFTLIVSPHDAPAIPVPPGWQKIVSKVKKYSMREFLFLGLQSRRLGANLVHIPHYTLPVGLRGCSVVTVHDLIQLRFPQYFNGIQRAYAALMMRHAVRNAGAVITGSQQTKRDIVESFAVPEERVRVIPYGIHEGFRPLHDGDRIEGFRRRFNLHAPYVLYAGAIKPHKNVPTLLRAFAAIVRSQRKLDLAFAGESLSGVPHIGRLAYELGVGDRVRDLGRLSFQDLVTCYNGAEVLVLPSRYEGFGFTALEAMACGTPAIVSTGGSLPEVVGEAALTFDPDRQQDLEQALARVLADSTLRADLAERGRKRAEQYSWETTARETLSLYESIL